MNIAAATKDDPESIAEPRHLSEYEALLRQPHNANSLYAQCSVGRGRNLAPVARTGGQPQRGLNLFRCEPLLTSVDPLQMEAILNSALRIGDETSDLLRTLFSESGRVENASIRRRSGTGPDSEGYKRQ
jgi:hypothetical protein